jgi:small redox-active disulfide protein 2
MSQEDVTQVSLGKYKVGITGLKKAIEEVRGRPGQSEAEIGQALFDTLKAQNYIPVSARQEYQQAFLREYKKTLGEEVEEEGGGPVIKLLGPGCFTCHRLEEMIFAVLSEMQLAVQVEVIRDANAIAAHGLAAMPAILINNQVKVMGKVPTREELKQWFSELQSC